MAIFNEAYLAETVGWHGKHYMSNEEKSDPKFRKEQFIKSVDLIKNIVDKASKDGKISVAPKFISGYFSDPDFIEVFSNWINMKNKKPICVAYFSKEDKESGEAKKAANYIISKYKEAKKSNKPFGTLTYQDKYGADLSYKL